MLLVQGALNPAGPAAAILVAADEGVFRPITSQTQLLELDRLMRRSWVSERGVRPNDVDAFVDYYGSLGQVRMHGRSDMPLTEDPGDNHLILVAMRSGATLVTRDTGIHRNHPEFLEVIYPGRFAEFLAYWRLNPPRYGLLSSPTGKANLILGG